MRRYAESSSASGRQKIEKFLIQQECPVCRGVRFRSETLEVKVADKNIEETLAMSLADTGKWLYMLSDFVSPEALLVVHQVLDDLKLRIDRIIDVGAGYLSLDQPAGSLSAGEWQRIKLASILGSGLTGVLYVLDEPTSGLHPRDTRKMIQVLRRLRDIGNTVVVIEHDLEIMKAADYIVDFGPGAGKEGGQIVACGSPLEIIGSKDSITGRYLMGNPIGQPERRKARGNGRFISIKQANVNNLKNVNVEIPLGKFVTVTGVSGSGKSSLVFTVLAEAADTYFNKTKGKRNTNVNGFENLDDVSIINQQTIGRSSRSNAATYIDLFTNIRDFFTALPGTKVKGLTAKSFSYNVPGGRCEKCQGFGRLSISMHFLPDVEVICPVCRGKRYQKNVLEIKYKGYNISDVLEMSIDEALILFAEESVIAAKLKVLQDVGLGYLGLGQSAVTLSGGEAQRLKLAKELAKSGSGHVLYLFDEPTTGLHPHDASRLIKVFDRLVSLGNSVMVIEHNTDVIMASDWVIDLGPEGGNDGGEIIAQGTPEEIMKHEQSATGKVLSQRREMVSSEPIKQQK